MRGKHLRNSIGDRALAAIGAVILGVLLAGFAFVVQTSQRDARQSLADRYQARAALTASFTRAFVDDLADRELIQATRLLSGATVDKATFDQVARSFDFAGAVLLDENGLLLQVWPSKPELIGTDLAGTYTHLATAVHGTVGVSEMVLSAAQSIPVTAVAVPFDTPSGRRVFSGAFTPSDTPLGSYFSSVSPILDSNAFLIDSSGHVLTSGHLDPVLSARLTDLHPGLQELENLGSGFTVAVTPVPGTPWRVALAVPTAQLYAPLTGSWTPWALWAALAGSGWIALMLFVRLGRARRLAALSARTDLLTGLANRRAIEESLERAVANAARHDDPLVALMIDLDHFKTINDTLGHHGGDRVLQQSSERLQRAIRTGDVAARWGGEEFLVILPHTDLLGALTVAERIRGAIARVDGGSTVGMVTASIGLAVLEGADVEQLLNDADRALYQAKAAGRDCIVTAATSQQRGDHGLGDESAVLGEGPAALLDEQVVHLG